MKNQFSSNTPEPVTIVVEGRRDVDVLRSLLSESQLKAFRFFAAQGKLSVISLARNILAHEATSVVVVVDSDGVNAAKVQSDHIGALESVAPPERYSVFAFDPSLDKILNDVGLVPNEPIPEEKKKKLRSHPQVQTFVKRLMQFHTSSEEQAEGGSQ